jgi:hypothetical protein
LLTSSRKRKILLVAVAVALLLGGVALVILSQPRSRPPGRHHHKLNVDATSTREVDQRAAPLLARFQAPQGSTPCETAYNGFKASRDANPREFPAVLPERDVFLERCSRLDEKSQQCMLARYAARHREECDPLFREITFKVFDLPTEK